MKLLFLVSTLIITLTSCSKNNNNQNYILNESSDIVVFDALSVRTSSVNGENTVPASTLDFATLQPRQSGTQDLIITNGLSSSLVFGSNDINASDISPFVMTENCSNKSIARNRSCKLTFSLFNNPSQTEIVLTKSLTIKGSVIQLTATLAPELSPVASSLIVSPSVLDFGLMKNGEQKELSIAITNRGTSTQNIPAPVISNPKLSITSNTCSSLERNRSCSIKIRYSAVEDENISQQSFSSIANNDMKHSVLVQTPSVNEPQVLTINPVLASSSFSLTEPQIQNSSASFINAGTISMPAPVQVVAQPSNGVTINSVSCSGGLSRGRNCTVSYSLNSALLAGGMSQVQLKLKSGSLESNIHTINLNVTKLAVACSLSNAGEHGVDLAGVTAVTGMVPNCFVQSCNESNYTLTGLGTTSKRCATLQKVYALQELSSQNQVRETEYIWSGTPFGVSWLYRNQSYALIDGVRGPDIEIDVPFASNFTSTFFPFSGTNFGGAIGVVTSCHLKSGGKIEPNGYCVIIAANNNPIHPLAFSVTSPSVSSFSVVSPQTSQTFSNTYTFRKLLPTSVPRTAVVVVTKLGAGGSANHGDSEGPDNTPRGMTLAKQNLENGDIEYIGSCNVKTDGTLGDPRGVFPWVSDGNVRPFKSIGKKVYFSGRGCSSTGSGISYEKWGLWEYDPAQPQTSTHPRRITRTLNQPGNWPQDEATPESMLVLNNKLYFSSVSMIANEVNGAGDFRRALFEYDPNLPLQQNQDLPNPNPKEILTGYEREVSSNSGASSYPAALTSHNGKIYFLGVYFRDTSVGSGVREYHNGIISYDPSLPLSIGDASVIESTDNPKFEWGYTEAQYALWQFDSWPSTSLFVDDNYFIFGAKMPRDANPVNNDNDTVTYPGGFANYDAFLARLRDDRGAEVTFVHRATSTIHKPDLCPGSCDGRPNYFKKVGSHYLFLSSIDTNDNNKQVFAAAPTGSLDGSLTFTPFNTNPSGQDVRSDKFNFTIHVVGNKAYMPLIPETGRSSMYEYDSTSGLLTRLMFGNLEGKTQNSFAIGELMQNGDILMRGQFTDGTAMIYSTSQSVQGTASNVINSNPYQKASGAWWYGFKEDENFYYYLRNGFCPTGTNVPFYVDYSTKARDANMALFNNTRYDSARCNGAERYRGDHFILLFNNN